MPSSGKNGDDDRPTNYPTQKYLARNVAQGIALNVFQSSVVNSTP